MSDSFATPWTIARQAPLPMGLPRQEYWSGLPFPPPGHLSRPAIETASPALAGWFFLTTEPPGKPNNFVTCLFWVDSAWPILGRNREAKARGCLLYRGLIFLSEWLVRSKVPQLACLQNAICKWLMNWQPEGKNTGPARKMRAWGGRALQSAL